MENKFKLYDSVFLLRDLIDGIDFISSNHQIFKKNSIGTILEINNDTCLVEFDYKEYYSPVVSVKMSDLELFTQ